MDHDYKLLRPFDEEAAKRGEPICTSSGKELWDYVAGPDSAGNLCLRVKSDGRFSNSQTCPVSLFRMKPICWVEGKPVYKDDRLYHKGHEAWGKVAAQDGNLLFINDCGVVVATTGFNMTWELPVVETWINIYPGSMCIEDEPNVFCSHGYANKELADQAARGYSEPRLMCIKVEIKKETK